MYIIQNISVQNSKTYLYRIQNLSVQNSKHICTEFKTYLYRIQNISVQNSKHICTEFKTSTYRHEQELYPVTEYFSYWYIQSDVPRYSNSNCLTNDIVQT